MPLLGCVCFPLSPSGMTLCLLHRGWASSAQPSTFPTINCSWTVWTRAGLHISDHPFLPVASHSPHLESRAQRLWGKMGKIGWDWPEESPSTHTDGSCPKACWVVLLSLVPKTSLFLSLNIGNNQSSYHCCLFKPLNNLMLCLLLVPIQLSPGLCGEILLNALFISLVLFPPCMYDANLLSFSFFLLFCIFLSCVSSCLLSLGVWGLFFFFFLAFLYKDSFNVVCSSFVNQLKNVFFF